MKRSMLLKALRLAAPALSDKEYIQSFSCFGFNGKTVRSHNDIIGIEVKCATDLEGGINGEKLLGLLGRANGKNVDFEYRDNDVFLKSGTTDGLIGWIPTDEFIWPFERFKVKIEVPVDEDFAEGIRKCLYSIDDDETSTHGGITFEIKNGGGVLWTTDSKTITRYELSQPIEGKSVTVMPGTFYRAILNMIKISKTKPILGLGKALSVAHFGDDAALYVKQIEDDKVKFEETLDLNMEDFVKTIPIPRMFPNAIKQAVLTFDGTKQELAVLTVKNQKFQINAKSSTNEVKRIVTIKEPHDDVEVHIEPNLIDRVLKVATHFYILSRATVLSDNDRYLYIVANRHTKAAK